MKALILVWASIFFAPFAFSQPGAVLPGAENIKVLSWNIYMLPGFLGEGKVPRAEAIGKLLASGDYDVIVFQEAFHHKARKTISWLLQPAFPFQAGPANQKLFSLKTNSGLWIFSRYPIQSTHSIIFETRRGIDGLSRKGALLVELKVNNQAVQIIGTHLQNAGNDWLRQNQCVELYQRLLKTHQRIGVPQIVCGDFNINRYDADEDYLLMLQMLDASDGDTTAQRVYSYDRSSNDLQVERGTRQDLIDYILVRANQAIVQCGERKIQVLQQRWHTRHEDLSDHYAIDVKIRFQNSQPIYTVSILK